MIDGNLIDEIVSSAYDIARRDIDCGMYAQEISEALGKMLDYCELGDEADDMFYDTYWETEKSRTHAIIDYYVSFLSGPGGSVSDYGASAASEAVREAGIYLVVDDTEGYIGDLMPALRQNALDADRELQVLADAGIA